MSRREEAPLITVRVRGPRVAYSAMTVYDYHVSEGEYIFEHGVVQPEQDPLEVPTWAAIIFHSTYPTVGEIWLGWGYAHANRFPLIINGPVPLTGPGFFRVVAVAANLNDYVVGVLSYRKVKKQ